MEFNMPPPFPKLSPPRFYQDLVKANYEFVLNMEFTRLKYPPISIITPFPFSILASVLTHAFSLFHSIFQTGRRRCSPTANTPPPPADIVIALEQHHRDVCRGVGIYPIDRLESDRSSRSSVRCCGEESLRGVSEASLSINLSRSTLFDFAR